MINFPNSPTDGQTFTSGNVSYVYSSSLGAWSSTTPVDLSRAFISDVAPSGVVANTFWWDSSTGSLYVNYNDGSSTQWVSAVPSNIDLTPANNYASSVGVAANTYANTIVQPRGPVLLSQYTANVNSSFDLTGWYSSSYDMYEMSFLIYPGTDNVVLKVQVSADNGATWDTGTNYEYAISYGYPGGGSGGGNVTNPYFDFGGNESAAASCSSCGYLKIFENGSRFPSVLGHRHYHHATVGTILVHLGGIYHNSATINGIRLSYSSGNISGSARIYGWPK